MATTPTDSDDLKKPPTSSGQDTRDGTDNNLSATPANNIQHAASIPKRVLSSRTSDQSLTAQVSLKTTGLDDDSAAEEASGIATLNTATVNNDMNDNSSINTNERKMPAMQNTTSSGDDNKDGFQSPQRLERRLSHHLHSDSKTKAATMTWSGAVARVPPRRALSEDAHLQNITDQASDRSHSKLEQLTTPPLKDLEAPRLGAFSIPGIDAASPKYIDGDGGGDDDDDDASLIDLEAHVNLPGSSEVSTLPSPDVQPKVDMTPPTAEPVTAELALDPEEIEARIKKTVEEQLHELRQEDMRARNSDVAQATPILVTHATRIDEETPAENSQERPPDNAEKRASRCRKAAWISLILVALIGIGAGVTLAVRNQGGNNNSESDGPSASFSRAPTEIPTSAVPTFPPTTNEPSQNPTAEPQSDEFFALLDILEPVLAEGPTFNNRTSLQDPSTVEYQVLDWLANHADGLSDGLELNANNTYRLLERYAGAIVYHRLNGDLWQRQFRFVTNVSVCEWSGDINKPSTRGIMCTDGIVTSIGMEENRLSGPLPPELFHLTMLESLRLGGNSITGTIPTELGRLTRLDTFRVFNAELGGTIPTEIGMLTDMLEFYVYSNSMTGTIPTEIGNMNATNYFGVDTNQMNGTIPSEIGTMSNLWHFYAYINDFTGTVPTEVQQLTLLELFDIELTQITGDLDPLFCDGTTLNFGLAGQLSSNCLASANGTLPRTNCTCCTWCCNTEGACEKQNQR